MSRKHPRRTRLLTTAAVAVLLVVGLGLSAGPVEARTTRLGSSDLTGGGRSAPQACRGVAADHVVLPGETWVGTDEADVVVVVGPDADVDTGAGDDLVCVHVAAGETGGSDVYTGYGNDTVITYSGHNDINTSGGGVDADRVYLNGGTESAVTGAGPDVIHAGGADDVDVDAGSGADAVYGSPGDDFVWAGHGEDVVFGFGGDDVLLGNDSDDQLHGGLGFDHLDGMGGAGDECVDHQGAEGADIFQCETVVLTPAGPGGLQWG